MRPVLVRMGGTDRLDILTLSAGRWRGSLLEGRRWGPVMSDMVEDLLEEPDGLEGERGAFDPPWLRGRSCRSGIEFAVRGRDGTSSSELAAMLRTAAKYLLYIPLGAGSPESGGKIPKGGVCTIQFEHGRMSEGPNLGNRQKRGRRFRAIRQGQN